MLKILIFSGLAMFLALVALGAVVAHLSAGIGG